MSVESIVIRDLHHNIEQLYNRIQELEAKLLRTQQLTGVFVSGKFVTGDLVTKVKGSQWTGYVVGWYSTTLTPIGYCVESNTEKGSVQIYPEAALQFLQT